MKKMAKKEVAKVVDEDFSSVFEIITRRRNRALMAVNVELLMTYWKSALSFRRGFMPEAGTRLSSAVLPTISNARIRRSGDTARAIYTAWPSCMKPFPRMPFWPW